MTSRRTKISPKTGRDLGHVTHTIFGSTVGYPSDSLASCILRGHNYYNDTITYLCYFSLIAINNITLLQMDVTVKFAYVWIGNGSHCGNGISFDKRLQVATMPILLQV